MCCWNVWGTAMVKVGLSEWELGQTHWSPRNSVSLHQSKIRLKINLAMLSKIVRGILSTLLWLCICWPYLRDFPVVLMCTSVPCNNRAITKAIKMILQHLGLTDSCRWQLFCHSANSTASFIACHRAMPRQRAGPPYFQQRKCPPHTAAPPCCWKQNTCPFFQTHLQHTASFQTPLGEIESGEGGQDVIFVLFVLLWF